MILLETRESGFTDLNTSLGAMVNSESQEDLTENDKKDTFHYEVPTIRASITLKMVPDSTTNKVKPVPEATYKLSTSTNSKITCEARESRFVRQPIARNIALPSVSKIVSISNDDDFEIPLEESLRAVEEYIAREKELASWKVGEEVFAKWKGNGLYYKAKVESILSTGQVTVLYETYDVTEEIDYKDLCKYCTKKCLKFRKGQAVNPSQNNLTCSKKIWKMRNRRKNYFKQPGFVLIFKRIERLRKKRLMACKKKYRVQQLKKYRVLFMQRQNCFGANISKLVS